MSLSSTPAWRSTKDAAAHAQSQQNTPLASGRAGDDEHDTVRLHVVARHLLPAAHFRESPVNTYRGEHLLLQCKALGLTALLATGFSIAAIIFIWLRPALERIGVNVDAALQRAIGPSWQPLAIVFGPDPGIASAVVASALSPANPRLGVRLLLLNAVARFVMWGLRLIFRQGRPFWVSPKVEMWHCPIEYGNPSGHALLWLLIIAPVCSALPMILKPNPALMTYPWPAFPLRIVCFGGCAFLLWSWYFVLVSSRLYLGTHFPHSIFFGAMLGVLLLFLITDRRLVGLGNWLAYHVGRDSGALKHNSCRNILHFATLSVPLHYAPFLLVLGFCLLCAVVVVESVVRVCDVLAPPDPQVWQRRAFMGCGPHDVLHTRSDIGGYIGAGALFGTLLGLGMPLSRLCPTGLFARCFGLPIWIHHLLLSGASAGIMLGSVQFLPMLFVSAVPLSTLFAWFTGFYLSTASVSGMIANADSDNGERAPLAQTRTAQYSVAGTRFNGSIN